MFIYVYVDYCGVSDDNVGILSGLHWFDLEGLWLGMICWLFW